MTGGYPKLARKYMDVQRKQEQSPGNSQGAHNKKKIRFEFDKDKRIRKVKRKPINGV